ncbi:SepM family pheromone-processing serine protease [Streptococcus dentapri]|uniref:SepM family pheromone-processing serine protease n=1 Tax=Streptococcus dentapri TaxID=573564 RepID=A0ABV8D1B1_9STRE
MTQVQQIRVTKKNKVFWPFVKRFKWWISGLILLLLLAFCFLFPLPYYVETPGGAYDINEVLTVDGQTNKDEGSYNFVAVSVRRGTIFQMVYAWLTPYTDIVSADEMTGGASTKDFDLMNQYYMENSQNIAIYQAFKLAKKEVKLDYKGVYVLSVADNSTFKGVLNIADTVTGLNGKTFKSSKDLIKYASSLKLGSKVSVQYMREGKKKSADGKVIKLSNGKNGIGISLTDHTEVKSDQKIEFSTEGVGGPSAGLMFTLSIYDQLNQEDLMKGRKIAGTGTIEQDGTVGDIGGVAQKVVSAANSGTDLFFVPDNAIKKDEKKYYPNGNNYEEAKKTAKDIGTKMKIVPVKNAQDAIDYLKTHR